MPFALRSDPPDMGDPDEDDDFDDFEEEEDDDEPDEDEEEEGTWRVSGVALLRRRSAPQARLAPFARPPLPSQAARPQVCPSA